MSAEFQDDREPNRGKSKGGNKLLVILLSVFGVLAVLCCGGGVFFAIHAKNQLEDASSNDPAVIAQTTKDIVDIKLPTTYRPRVSINMDVWFIPAKVKMVLYDGPGGGRLSLMEAANKIAGGDDEQFKEQMRQQKQGDQVRELDVSATESRTFTIRGEEVAFKFKKGTERKSNVPFREVSGSFDGRDGKSVVLFVLQVPEKHYNEKEVVAIIKSIK